MIVLASENKQNKKIAVEMSRRQEARVNECGDRTRGGVSVVRVVRFVPLFEFVAQKTFSLSIAW